MKWIEFVRVRSSETAVLAMVPTLSGQIREIEESVPEVETFFLQHALYDGDLAVMLVWRTRDEPRITREGTMVAEVLKRLGLVDHGVWLPADAETRTKTEVKQ